MKNFPQRLTLFTLWKTNLKTKGKKRGSHANSHFSNTNAQIIDMNWDITRRDFDRKNNQERLQFKKYFLFPKISSVYSRDVTLRYYSTSKKRSNTLYSCFQNKPTSWLNQKVFRSSPMSVFPSFGHTCMVRSLSHS